MQPGQMKQKIAMMDEVLSWPRRSGGENVRPSEPDNRAKTRKPAQQNFRYRLRLPKPP